MKSILEYGAVGDGVTNCSYAICEALKNEKEIFFPKGVYSIEETIYIPSDRHIKLDDEAVIFAADGCFKGEDAIGIITNADVENGNENIVIEGGKVDANNINNARLDWLHGPNSGLTFAFKKVKNLTIRNLISHNSESFNFRLCRVEDFLIEDITFSASHISKNQDGVHISGWCKNGVIKNIKAEYGTTNDDLIAMNADETDVGEKQLKGIESGPISDIYIENVYAQNCWSAVRIVSIFNSVENITVKNLTAGVRAHAINMDATRYCETPIFKDEEYPKGVGSIKNINFENITFWYMGKEWEEEILTGKKKVPFTYDAFNLPEKVMIPLEINGDITIKNLARDLSKDTNPEVTFVGLKHLHDVKAEINGEEVDLDGKDFIINAEKIDLKITKSR